MELPREEDIIKLAESSVNSALKKGADEAEVFIYHGVARTVAIERGQIEKVSRLIDLGVGIRAVANKSLGFAYTNLLGDESSVENAISKAVKSAKASKPDPEWPGFPTRRPLSSVEGIFDKDILNIYAEDLVKMASAMLEGAEEVDKRVFPVEGGVGASYICRAVANSYGVSAFDYGTVMECSLAAIARENDNVTPICFEFDMDRSCKVDPESIGKAAARIAVLSLKAKRVETKQMKVILAHFALQQLLSYTLLNAIKADNVQRNQSAFQGKIGEKIASEIVTAYDDGLLRGGLHTWRFDGEGVPQQKTPIIERGILRGFIYDNYTAKKENKESTGNATRSGYMSTPNIEPTNFHIMPGKSSPEELIGRIDEGILVHSVQGAHSSNPTSGEFSVVATPAFIIKNGKIAYAARGTMLAGNIFDLIKNISSVADNEKKVGSIVAPWVLVENIKVVGR